MKVETFTFEYEHCGECPHCETGLEDRCDRGKRIRIIPDIWGDIPNWCPLETKEVNNG